MKFTYLSCALPRSFTDELPARSLLTATERQHVRGGLAAAEGSRERLGHRERPRDAPADAATPDDEDDDQVDDNRGRAMTHCVAQIRTFSNKTLQGESKI